MATEEAILGTVETLYASALKDDSWSSALDTMSDLLGSVGVSFEVFDTKAKAPLVFEFNPGLPLPDKLDYLEYYSSRSPRLTANLRAQPGSISFDHMILSEQEMDKDEFYADFMTPLGLRYFLSVQVLSTPSHQGVFAAQRSKNQGHASDDDIATMRKLAPHLQQATDLRFRLADLRHQLQAGLQGFDLLTEGCITLSKEGDVISTNAGAQQMFSEADGISCQGKRLTFNDHETADRYRQCLHQMSNGGTTSLEATARDFPVRRPSGKRPYVVSLRPLPPITEFSPTLDHGAALLFIRDTDGFQRLDKCLLAESYHLSASEADIAAEVDHGLSVSAIAQKRGVAVSTIRSQLYALMAKLGVKRQTELVQLLTRYRLPFA